MDLDKLLRLSDSCIHEEPPMCTSNCPFHMDVIAFISEIEKGRFDKAYSVMERRLPFARLIGSICDHPCEGVCVMKDNGGALNISELEKVAIKFGYTPPKKAFAIPKNKGNIAVIGGGISGMSAALELDKKGYDVTIYEKNGSIGGSYWSYVGTSLEKEILEDDIRLLLDRGIGQKLNVFVDNALLKELTGEYDAVYLGTGFWEDELSIHKVTFRVGDTSVFAGGGLFYDKDSVVLSASSGKRAAASIDRYVKNISLTAARDREGPFDTLLKYDLKDVMAVAPVKKTTSIYNKEEAMAEAARCLKCQCRKCIEACSHLTHFDISPKSYMRQINQSERIILGTHYANKMINSCTMCGLCKEECFKDISMKDVIKETRESMVERDKMPPSAHDFALKDMKFSNSERFSMARKQPNRFMGIIDDTGKTRYLFYPGCQLPASCPEYIDKIYKYLLTNIKGGVGIYLGCCGAPAHWGGRQGLMNENADSIKKVWNDMERPTFILACSSCAGIFEEYLPEVSFVSLWEVFIEKGLPPGKRVTGGPLLNVHDACATRYNKKIHESVRNIAEKSGYIIQELKYAKERTKCCGYGGLVYYANRDQSKAFVRDRIGESNEDLLVYCAMCKDLFINGGKRAYHVLDLIFGDDLKHIAERKMPGLSERHRNRARVKSTLLREIWGEKSEMGSNKGKGLNLVLSDAVLQLMEDRYILAEDIESVIYNAQKNKERFFNPEDESFLARLRLDNVTYWVGYEEKDGKIFVNSVYSHRMEVVEE